jgi:hypothetical protein
VENKTVLRNKFGKRPDLGSTLRGLGIYARQMLRKKNDVEKTRSPKTPHKKTKIKGVTVAVFISKINFWRLIGCKKYEKFAQQKLYWLAEKAVDYSECSTC